jgi:thiamine-phosphate pyrophosphorylase
VGWGLADRHLYLCTPDRADLEQFLEACILGGVDVVQLRDKNLEARTLVERAQRCLRVCAEHGVPFVMNDRPDLALASGADGVHVGQDDVAVAVARQILGPDALVGLSTHSPRDLEGAAEVDADYLSAGPVVATPTKPGRPGTGTAYAALATASDPRPVFVTGGVSPDTIGSLLEAGLRHFVVVRWLTESPDPGRAARQLRDVIDRGLAQG